MQVIQFRDRKEFPPQSDWQGLLGLLLLCGVCDFILPLSGHVN